MLTITAIILGVLILGVLGSVSYLIYGKHSDNTLVYRVARIVPYPAAKVNGRWISYADYLFEVRYRKNIYENPSSLTSSNQEPVDFKSEDGKKLLASIQASALKQVKVKAVVKQLASEQKVKVSGKELNTAIDELVKSQGGDKKFKTAIEQFYGWDMDDFRKEYRLQLLQQKLQTQYLPSISTDQRKQADEAQTKATNGEDFAALVKQYSQDAGSKDNGGDLGFISADTPFVKEFKDVALKLEPGQVSAVVPSQFGFHIIKAIEKKDDQIKVSHILINYAKDLESVITERLASAKTHEYIKLPPQENSDGAVQAQ